MNLEQYSILLSVALMGLTLVTVASIVVYIFSAKFRSFLQNVDYFLYIKVIGILAIIATLGALTYQFGYKTPVCEYCWWQRIFMFPIDIIVLTTLGYKIRHNEITIAILAGIGSVFAAYHYYFHYQVAVLDNILSMPCSAVGIIPSCT